MLEVIQNWPRSELFSTDADSLYQTTTGVIALADRRRLRLFLRRDPYGRFYSCLVFLPRDRYTTTSRLAMQEVLLDELGGKNLEFSTRIGETSLAQVHFTVHTVDPEQAGRGRRRAHPGADDRGRAHLGRPARRGRLRRAARAGRRGHRRVDDDTVTVGAESATEQGQRFASVFPEAYKEDFDAASRRSPTCAGSRALQRPGDLDMAFYVLAARRAGRAPVQALPRRPGRHAVPGAAGAAADGRRGRRRAARTSCAARTARSGGSTTSACASTRTCVEGRSAEEREEQRTEFEEAFGAIWRGDAESDRFNSLVLRGGLTWRQAALLRAYARYLRQAGTPYSHRVHRGRRARPHRRGHRAGPAVRDPVRPAPGRPTSGRSRSTPRSPSSPR